MTADLYELFHTTSKIWHRRLGEDTQAAVAGLQDVWLFWSVAH